MLSAVPRRPARTSLSPAPLRRLSMGAALALVALIGCSSGSSTTGPAPSAQPQASASAAPSTPAAPARTPTRREGSAAVLFDSDSSVVIADEVHDALIVAPASFADPSLTRVVQLPGPPAQIVAAGDLVFVTVRTLPEPDAEAARAIVRGPAPDPSAAHRLLPETLGPGLEAPYLAPSEYRVFLSDSTAPSAAASAAPGAAPASSAAGSSAAAPSAPVSAAPSAAGSSASAAPQSPPPPKKKPGGTKPRPFDTAVVRKSQGGLLLALRKDPEKGFTETGRLLLPPDAWGLALTPDGRRAVVSHAWSATVSVVDIDSTAPSATSMKVAASFSTAREPRGVTVTNDGKTAYVSHLVGSDLTRIDALDAAPKLAVSALPPAPHRTRGKTPLPASLGYAVVLSPDDTRLFAPRHAIGAEASDAWWGVPVVDVLDRKTGQPAVAPHDKRSPTTVLRDDIPDPPDWHAWAGRLPAVARALVQPRAALYRKKTDTLLIAGEGMDTLVELDALAPDPALFHTTTLSLAKYDTFGHDPVRGGAPTALALTADERSVYVYCASTFDLVKIDLDTHKSEWLRLADDGLPDDAAQGRRLYSNARSAELSGGLACSACHPDGRDDGYVWREALLDAEHDDTDAVFLGFRSNMKRRSTGPFGFSPNEKNRYYPRQTPMLAGRVRAPGPYGWHAEARTLIDRLVRGFRLHRAPWDRPAGLGDLGPYLHKIDSLADFLQSGLLPPPTVAHPLTDQEKRGKEIFDSEEAQCAKCHVPDTGFTDRTAYPIRALPVQDGFDPERNQSFKTPSLLFIAGTAPYFHDGSQATLEDLIKNNGTRMGDTGRLSAEDRAALVAYLSTL
ncbi:MAG: c-type cytochrome [Polyangiaceae bacterium]